MSATAAQPGRVPGVRAWRTRFRRARRRHHRRPLRETLTDLYMLFWFLLVYGTAVFSEVRRHLATAHAGDIAVERLWLGLALLLGVAGLSWRGLRAVGPVLATESEQTWIVSTPLDRRGWLLPRFLGMAVAGAAAGAAFAAGVLVLGGGSGHPARVAVVGGLLGATLPAGAAIAQLRARPGETGRGARVGSALLGSAALLTLGVVAAHYGGGRLPSPSQGAGDIIAVGAVLVAGRSFRTALRELPRFDRARLGSGAELAAAAITSAIWLDPTVLTAMLERRRWRTVGRVRSRRVGQAVPGVPDRVMGLLRMEGVRVIRRPGAIAVFGALALVQYGVMVVAPSVAGVARVVLGYLAAGRLMSGLRTVASSPTLRRSLGGSDRLLRIAHLIVPAVAMSAWWLATIPASPVGGTAVGPLILAGIIAAAYRAATRGARAYTGAIIETPFGILPVDLVMRLARGPDLLGLVLLIQIMAT